MARGAYYTETEDARLKALCEDNEGEKYIDLAFRAQKYGICANRNLDALAQHISQLLNSNQKEGFSGDDDNEDSEKMILKKELKELKRKYEAVCKAVIDSCVLYKENKNALKLDLHAIRNWMSNAEPERVNAKRESLQMELEKASKGKR